MSSHATTPRMRKPLRFDPLAEVDGTACLTHSALHIIAHASCFVVHRCSDIFNRLDASQVADLIDAGARVERAPTHAECCEYCGLTVVLQVRLCVACARLVDTVRNSRLSLSCPRLALFGWHAILTH